jgi:hypothetical protein
VVMGNRKSSMVIITRQDHQPMFSSRLITIRLYPLTQGSNGTPKALLPIGNVFMIDRVLTWVENAGIKGR